MRKKPIMRAVAVILLALLAFPTFSSINAHAVSIKCGISVVGGVTGNLDEADLPQGTSSFYSDESPCFSLVVDRELFINYAELVIYRNGSVYARETRTPNYTYFRFCNIQFNSFSAGSYTYEWNYHIAFSENGTYNSYNSGILEFKVSNPPAVSISRDKTNYAYGATATFSASASYGKSSLSYQWYRSTVSSGTSGTAISGATSSTYRVTANNNSNGYYYYCKVSDGERTATSSYLLLNCASPTLIGLNETKTVNINSAGEIVRFTYTPPTKTKIRFYSTGNSDTYAYLYDNAMNELTHDDDSGSNNNFQITYTLEANKMYIFGCKYYSSSSTGSYSVTLESDRKPLSDCTITFNQSSYYFDNTAKMPTVTVKDGSSTLTENTDYTVTYSDNINVGTATVTVTGIGNYKDSVNKTFTILYESISLNSIKAINITTAGSKRYFCFIPSGNISVQFYSTGSADTYGHLYDANLNQLASNDDGGESNNFKLTYDLTAGTTYIFACRLYNSSNTGNFDVKLEQVNSDTQSPTVSLSSTNNVASSQTVTISLSDNVGIRGYYWGTSSNYSNNSYTSTSSNSILKTVNSSGTYYATAVNTSGIVSSTVSITFYKTTLNANGGSVNPDYILTKSGNSFNFPTPTRSNYTYVGWGTSSSTSASNTVKSLSPTSNSTYYAIWSYADSQKPTASLSSTNNVASSQTVTISLSDNVGIRGYYWGTSSSYSNNTYTTTSNTSISKTVDSTGTYYATAVDTSGNVSSTVSITFYKTTLNANGGSVSPTSVLTKSGNSFTFPIPTRSNCTYVGWSTSTYATSGVKTLSPSSNVTYYVVWKPNHSFVWGQDNWNFDNWSENYSKKPYGSYTYRELINDDYINTLANNLNNVDYTIVF